MGNRTVFLDRDGTMAKDVPYCRRPQDFELFPGVAKAIKLLNERGFKVIVITNQSGIARGYFTEETLAEIHEKMAGELAKESAWVDAIYYCPHHPDDGCECRKPKPKMLLEAASELGVDLLHSYVVGDLSMDIEMGKRVGGKTILISNSYPVDETVKPDATVRDLPQAVQIILAWAK